MPRLICILGVLGMRTLTRHEPPRRLLIHEVFLASRLRAEPLRQRVIRIGSIRPRSDLETLLKPLKTP